MRSTRREFLEDSLLATAAALLAAVPKKASAQERQSSSPNEKLGVAVIGVRGRGGSHIAAFASRKDTQVLYLCDPDTAVLEARARGAEKLQGTRPQLVRDMRRVFDDPRVDIVTIATPNHWHALAAIWAMQAGKDVYVEKPVSHNVSEGRRIVQVAQKYGRICQTGTQCRSNPGMRQAMELIHQGKIGRVRLARGLCYKRRPSIGPRGRYPVPKTVDYDLWTGPAPLKPLTRPRFHYDWHWQWDYGNGDLGNQGIHQMDLCRWALQVNDIGQAVFSFGGRLGYQDAGETANTQVTVHDWGSKRIIFEVRGLPTPPYRGAKVGIVVYGSEGYFVSPSYSGGVFFDAQGRPVQTLRDGSDRYHYANFLQAVRSRNPQLLTAPILEGHLSSALCHLGNISYRLGEPTLVAQADEVLRNDEQVYETFRRFAAHLKANGLAADKTTIFLGRKLKVDSQQETIPGDEQAVAMLTREYRRPFVVPAADAI